MDNEWRQSDRQCWGTERRTDGGAYGSEEVNSETRKN